MVNNLKAGGRENEKVVVDRVYLFNQEARPMWRKIRMEIKKKKERNKIRM